MSCCTSLCRGGYAPLPTDDGPLLDAPSVPAAQDPREQARSFHSAEEEMQAVEEAKSSVIESVLRELRIPGEMSKTSIWADSNTDFAPCCLLRFGSCAERFVFQAMQLLALLELIFVPFVLAFTPIYNLDEHRLVQIIDLSLASFYFFLSVPVRLRTSIVGAQTRKEVVNCCELLYNTINTKGFWLDLLAFAASPCLYVGTVVDDEFARESLKVLALLRLAKLWRLGRPTMRDQLLGSEPFAILYLRVVVTLFVTAHLFACTWFFAKMHSPIGYGHEWTAWNGWGYDALSLDDVDGSAMALSISAGGADGMMMHYFRALKDGIYMLIGWGGPDAMSLVELFIVLMLGPSSTIVAGLVLSKMMDINNKRGIRETQYSNKMAMVSAACDGLSLPEDLRERISRYHSYLHFHQMDTDSQDMLFSGLSINLLAEVKVHILRSVLDGTSFFEGLPPRLLSFLVVSFEEVTFSPGDFVVRKNEIGDAMYIVLRGGCHLCIDEACATTIKTLTAGMFFGEISLVFPFPRTAWIYASGYTVLMQLDKEKFDNVLQTAPDEKQALLARIVKSFRNLVPDLEKVMKGSDVNRAQQAKQVLGQLTTDFVLEPASPTSPTPKSPGALAGGSMEKGSEKSARSSEASPKIHRGISWSNTDEVIPPAGQAARPREREMIQAFADASVSYQRQSQVGLQTFASRNRNSIGGRRSVNMGEMPRMMTVSGGGSLLSFDNEDTPEATAEEDAEVREKLAAIEARMDSVEDLLRSFIQYARTGKAV